MFCCWVWGGGREEGGKGNWGVFVGVGYRFWHYCLSRLMVESHVVITPVPWKSDEHQEQF